MKELLTTVEHQEYLAVLALRHGCKRMTFLARSFMSFIFSSEEERDLFESYVTSRDYNVDYKGIQAISDGNIVERVYYIIDITKPDW